MRSLISWLPWSVIGIWPDFHSTRLDIFLLDSRFSADSFTDLLPSLWVPVGSNDYGIKGQSDESAKPSQTKSKSFAVKSSACHLLNRLLDLAFQVGFNLLKSLPLLTPCLLEHGIEYVCSWQDSAGYGNDNGTLWESVKQSGIVKTLNDHLKMYP